jgi:hypothetical protein
MPIATNPDTGEVVFLDETGKWLPAKTAVNPETKEMMAFDGKDWSAVTTHGKGVLGYIDDAVRAIANGATFGFADEISAKANEMIGRGSYDQNVAKERARNKQIPAGIAIPGEIAGGVASALATAPVTGPAAVASGLSKLPRALQFALGGAAAGGLSGAGNAEGGLAERATAAVPGAAIGAGIGGATPYVLGAANRTYQAVKGAISPEASVSGQLGRAMLRDNVTPQDALQRAASLNAEKPGVATIADVGGENVRGLVERVAQTPGGGRTVTVPFLTGRQEQQMSRVADDLSTLTGTSTTAAKAIEDTIAARSKAAEPLYDAALNFNARADADIVNAWTKETGQGWGKSILNSPSLKRNLQSEYGIKDPGDAPLMVLIDAWKKTADDLVQGAIQSGNKNNARVISDMRDRVLTTVDAANPAYASARAAWSGPSRYLDAINDGKNILSPKIGAEELAGSFAKLNTSEQEAFRIGVISAVKSKMGNDPSKMGDMTKYLRSPEMRDKIAAILPSPQSVISWNKRLDFEVASSELTGKALGNSATARRLAEMKDSESLVGDLVLEAMAGAPPVGLFKKLLTAAPKAVRDTLRSKSDRLLAETLTDPQALNDLQSIINRAQSAASPVSQRAIGGAVTGASAEANAR